MSATAAYFSEPEFVNAQRELAHLRRIISAKIVSALPAPATPSGEPVRGQPGGAAPLPEIDAGSGEGFGKQQGTHQPS